MSDFHKIFRGKNCYPFTPEQLEDINYMISNRNLSILLLITGFVGISFGGLIMRNINTADPWQIAFYRALAFLFSITLILFHQHRLGIVTKIKKNWLSWHRRWFFHDDCPTLIYSIIC